MTITLEWWVIVILAIIYVNVGFIISGAVRNKQGKPYMILAPLWPLVVCFVTIISMITTLQNIGKIISDNAEKNKKK